MQSFHNLTDEQTLWLQRIYQSREDSGLIADLGVPDEVQSALIAKGLIRRWRNGGVEITLGGIREAARWPLGVLDTQAAEAELA